MNKHRIAVVVASAGRPDAVAQLLECLDKFDNSPRCYVSVPVVADLPPETGANCEVLVGTRGAAAQRNVALDRVPEELDYVFFFDDDALPRDDYIDNAVRFLDENPNVIAVTGNVILDGAPLAREIEHTEAVTRLCSSYLEYPSGDYGQATTHSKLYGCNFVVRWASLRDLRFDERLPLYSWLEDYDYARQVVKRGRIVTLSGCIAVHRGSSNGGRLAHLRFGYSQLANPVYLRGKGTFTSTILIREVLRPILKNILLSTLPGEQRVWRRRRLRGNIMAAQDWLRGCLEPERILQLEH